MIDLKTILAAAIAAHRAGRLADAEAGYRKVLKHDRKNGDALNLLGLIAVHRKQTDEALKLYAAAIAANPNAPTFHYNRANALVDAGQYEDATVAYNRAIKLRREYADAWLNLGALKYKQKDLTGAIMAFRELTLLCPTNGRGHFNLGRCLAEQGDYASAEASLRRAMEIEPAAADAPLALAKVYSDQWRFADAVQFAQSAIKIDPHNPLAWANLGTYFSSLDRYDDALPAYERALALDPRCADAAVNKALAELTLRRFKTGWDGYASSLLSQAKGRDFQIPDFPWPQWNGEPLKGKHIFIWSDQGLGDQILYSSMLPDIIAEADSVVLGCSDRLAALFRRSFPKLTVTSLGLGWRAALGDRQFDYRTSIIEAGRWRRTSLTNFPNRHSYLTANADLARKIQLKYRQAFPAASLRIGISWRSFAPHTGANKGTPVAEWGPLVKTPGVQFISLQYGPKAEIDADIADFQRLHGVAVLNDTEVDNGGDLDHQAAQIQALDLVVTVSNTTAHLAGAVGVPVWVTVPEGKAGLWYWSREGGYNLWYPRTAVLRAQLQASAFANALGQVVQQAHSQDSKRAPV